MTVEQEAPVESRRAPALEWAAGLVLIGLALWASTLHGTDLKVYRAGVHMLLENPERVYAPGLEYAPGKSLPFTYPPFAALLMVPLGLLSFPVANGLHAALSVGLLYLVCRDFAPRAASLLPERWARFCTPVLLTALACWTGPFRDSLAMGQINIPLFAVIYLACARWGLGVLAGAAIGLAGAVKLTPLALGLVPLARGRWRMLGGIAAGFLVPTLLAWWAMPGLSRQFWLSAVRDPARVGGVGYWDNISFEGVLARFGMDMKGIWFLASVALVFLVFAALSGLRGRLDMPAQLGLAASAMLAVSPISWSHHATWFGLIVYAWVSVARSTGRCRAALSAVAGFFGVFMGIGMPVFHWAAAQIPGAEGSLAWKIFASMPALALVVGGVLSFRAILTMPGRPGLFGRPASFPASFPVRIVRRRPVSFTTKAVRHE